MTSLVVSALVLVGLFQLLLWVLFEIDTRRRNLDSVGFMVILGLIPLFGTGIFLWYFLDRNGFVERAEALAPE